MLCCLCLSEFPKIMGIFDENIKHLNIADILNKHFWFKVHQNDLLMSHICDNCWKKIYEFHEFYKDVQEKHKSFKNIVKEEGEVIYVKREQESEQKIFEHDMIVEDFEKIIEESKENVQKNPLENEEELQRSLKHTDNGNEHSNTSDDYETSEKSEMEDILESKQRKRNLERNCPKKLKKLKKRKISHRLDPKLTKELIKKHIPMLCDLCVFSGETFSDIVAHFKEHHVEVQPYIMCCNRKFTRRYCIDQHAVIHENPDSFRCNECNKSFTTTYGLRTHNLNHHDPEEKRIHACDFCPRRFGKRQLLEVHRQTHIPKEDWTISCPKCTTRTVKFVSQYLLNTHISMFHRRETNICHVCAKEIKNKKAFEKHVRAHFEESGPRVKCTYPNCERWLKDEDNLKTHMQLHNLSGKTYKCSECDRECPNRRALTNHKRYVHTNMIYRCEECDKSFKKAISLKEHMTQHTGETLYNCPFCTRTFNSNANMHSHKKKQHPIEWKELRRKNIGPLPE